MKCTAVKPQRGLTLVASHSYGWYGMQRGKRAFRYATANNIAYLKARYPIACKLPAIGMAGYQYLMPTALLAKLELGFILY